ncbi:hypothetical protein [Saccharopolyspora shandongensis]|uniref:hypothetical protein n=1 Tax=Saccharopolyspora shandongensis TaxID=418495 RepID=UPI0033E5BD6A
MTSTENATEYTQVREQAKKVLRSTPIVRNHGIVQGLGEQEAERAAIALGAAGLLCTHPADRETRPLTTEQAAAVYQQRLAERHTVLIAQDGTVRLIRTGGEEWAVTDYNGDHYRGTDLGEAVEVYNRTTN